MADDAHSKKHRVLSRHTPAATRSITQSVVLKSGGVFLVVEPAGSLPVNVPHGGGLYWKDVRWLDGYELTVDGVPPDVLYCDASSGDAAAFQLSDAGMEAAGQSTVGVTWRRRLDGGARTLEDRLELRNYGMCAVETVLALRFAAHFDDIFLVRGVLEAPARAPVETAWEGDRLTFRRRGLDGSIRAVEIRPGRAPDEREERGMCFRMRLAPGEAACLTLGVTLREEAPPTHAPAATLQSDAPPEERAAWRTRHVDLRSDSTLLDRMLSRAIDDLGMLRMRLDGAAFFAAGLPWFGTLFGRDSAITAMQTIAWNPEVAAETLRVLARYQGTRFDAWRDEQPGKILHELRRGDLARAGDIPHTPYYGTVDATPLFLCLVERTLAWTGDRALLEELRPAVDAALGWVDDATAGDGWAWYGSAKNAGLANQGWKDSGDAIMNADGSLAEPPIALVEVQGYVYRAWARLGALYERLGEAERGATLRRRAEALRARIRAAFQLGEGRWALALQRDERPCAVSSSNPGHLLWCGVVEPDEARALARRLTAPDMFSGWGVRTLTQDNPRYNPVGYHVGTVWPHDNSILAAGLRRYGLDDEAVRLCDVLLEACSWFGETQMPELFAGFSREEYRQPVPYPVACRPQAWGAGAVLGLLHTLLGLTPDALGHRLRIVRPRLPTLADELFVRGLRVGGARVDLRFARGGSGVEVEVLKQEGQLEIGVER